MRAISAREAERLASLQGKLGDRTLRQILTPEGNRILRPERMSNLLAGRGRLSEAEAQQIENATRNASSLKALKARGESKREFKVNRALRDWLNNGKPKGVDYKSQDTDEKERQLKAIKALRFLGVDPSDGTFYVRKGGK